MGLLVVALLLVLRFGLWCLLLPGKALLGLCALILLADGGDDEQGASGRRDWMGPHRAQHAMHGGRFWMGEAARRRYR